MHTHVECCRRRLSLGSECLDSLAPAKRQNAGAVTCMGSTKGQACSSRALPFTQHCFQRILSTTSLVARLLTARVLQVLWISFNLYKRLKLYRKNITAKCPIVKYKYDHLSTGLVPSSFSADILLNRSQQLFASCTAKFADGQQCSIPVFDITHQTPLCEEHAKKMVSSMLKVKVVENMSAGHKDWRQGKL